MIKSRSAPAFGRFSEDNLEYIISDPFAPPRVQVNYLWNDTLIAGVNQFGSGDGVFQQSDPALQSPGWKGQADSGWAALFLPARCRERGVLEFWPFPVPDTGSPPDNLCRPRLFAICSRTLRSPNRKPGFSGSGRASGDLGVSDHEPGRSFPPLGSLSVC